MKKKVLFIERKASEAVSIEKVFRQIAKTLTKEKFSFKFEQVPYQNDFWGTLKNLLFYKHGKADIYHITGHVHFIALLLPAKRTVLTIHDVGILNIRKGFRRYILKKLLFDFPVKKLKYVTTISEKTKRDIIFHTHCREEKIRVIENPLREGFYSEKKKSFNEQSPRILQIGTTYNKNLINLIESLRDIECRLVIIGNLDQEILELLTDAKINYENLKNISDDELRKEYQKADIVAFCSTFEGFGLPIIEAQSMKTPVITSNISPMKEVAGGGAVLVDPHSVNDIENGFLKIIGDRNYRESIIDNGIENVKRFNDNSIVKLYEAVYEEIIKRENN